MDSKTKLSAWTMVLHWTVAAVMIVQLAIGFYMAGEVYGLYEFHKSTGVIVTFFVLWRIVWRIRNGWPDPLYQHLQTLALMVHWGLIGGTLLMPLSGMLYSGASGHGFGVLGWTIVPVQHSAENVVEVVPYSIFWMDFGYAVHSGLGYVLAGLITIHIAAALKHHCLDRDHTLLRMLGRQVEKNSFLNKNDAG